MKKYLALLVILITFISCENSQDESSLGTLNERISYLESKVRSLETRYDILARRIPVNVKQQEPVKTQSESQEKNSEEKFIDSNSPVQDNINVILDEGFFDDAYIGTSSPTIVVIIYSDLSCIKCKKFLIDLIPSLRQAFKSNLNVQIRLRDFPLEKYPQSKFIAMASHCVGEQGNYWNFIEKILQFSAPNTETIMELARDPQLKIKDQAALARCLKSDKYSKEVETDKNSGKQIGVIGTPSVFIGKKISDKKFQGALIRGQQEVEIIHKYIDVLLRES